MITKGILTLITSLTIVTVSFSQKSNNMKYQKVSSTDFYDSTNYNGLLKRLDNITPNSERIWGEMSASQMLHHLNLAIGSGLGYYTLPDVSTFMSRGFNQFMILNVLKRFPISTQTAKPLKVIESFNFETEKNQLKEILTKAYNTKGDGDCGKHTYFGKMKRKDCGKLIMIHCNHHFQQFSN